MNLTNEEKEIGRSNYYESIGVSRRDFLKGVAVAGVTSGAGLGAMYFGYGSSVSDPVRVAVIGTGDEGNVLIGAINPNYIQVKAICDIRPYNQHRAFFGDWASPSARLNRKGLMDVYGWKTHEEALNHVKVYTDYQDVLKDPDIEAVIIAVPLFLHHKVAMDAMAAGKHVLTEKLMAYNVAQCKEMGRMAARENLLLATGHQRHYSVLYDNAVNLIRWGLLGELHHIRAQWHRNNLPGNDSWAPALPGGRYDFDKNAVVDEIQNTVDKLQKAVDKGIDNPVERHETEMQLAQWKAWAKDVEVDAAKYGYEEIEIGGRKRSALEELCRWRLWTRTGGGLMAELGSHQLDAASIFVSALRRDGKKAHPLSVHAVGGRHIFPQDRDAFDHVYCMFEFPGPGYEPREPKDFYGYYDRYNNVPDPKTGIPPYTDDNNKRIVLTYSSINGNGYGGYGEVVMGTKGTLILEREQEIMVFKDADTKTKIQVKDDGGGPAVMAYETGSKAAVAAQGAHNSMGPVSRGYTEEMEHWAWCIRNRDPENRPRCYPEVALGDACIALTTNVAMQQAAAGKGGHIQFKEEWFQVDSDETPDGSTPQKI
ncbi:MAG: Gfo/Idh/MocA family oxidoreductase [Pirellulales bacterium]